MGSVAESKYCEMGEFCIQVLAANSPGPVRLGPSDASPLCRRCTEAKYRPGDIEILRHHKKLLAAASALLDHKTAEEYVIIPTLVFATLSDRDVVYASIGERLAAARRYDPDWTELFKKFSLRFGDIKPKDSVSGVPVVWRPPVGVFLVPGKSGKPFDAIKIEIHKRVESREVRALYAEALDLHSLPYDSDRGHIAWASFGDSLQIVVRPEEDPILHPILEITIPRRLRESFAHPAGVEAVYEALKGRRYLKGPGGGGPTKHYNAILAVVAWYLGRRVKLSGAGAEGREIRRLVEACLAEPRKERVPELRKRRQLWRALEPILPHIKQTEAELRAHIDLNNPYGQVHKTF